ncbi:potassium channel family protein [Thalassobacillus pellis]|uniref:potassium channel family protein n=1 Tax=Thalassobacillus pellis TaxID=748008 RepID=UPI001961B082|nr:potassium channel family protein [Thalassobacillus pellis]MBM7553860.1 potassium channel LctB [Thalassobacillus pellis]
MVETIILLLILFIIGVSLISFFRQIVSEEHHFSLAVFFGLLILYTIILCGFGLIYLILSLNGVMLLEGEALQEAYLLERIGQAIYFSGVTLLTVGYGDIIPVGWGRPLALLESLIGYIIPAALFVKVFIEAKQYSE